MVGLFNSLIDPIFRPLLGLNLFFAIAIISFFMSVIITIVYKLMTDQSLMKDLKSELKTLQKQMKELRKHPEKMMKVQKKVMETNMKYMMHSMKPTLITFLPIIIIFGWLNSHLAFMPLMPDQEFTTTVEMEKGSAGAINLITPEGIKLISDPEQKIVNNKAVWTLKGDAGEYFLEYVYNENEEQKKELIIDTEDYAEVELKVRGDSSFSSIRLGNEKTKPLGSVKIFGWQPGWLALYIILSIVFSMSLRKILKIY